MSSIVIDDNWQLLHDRYCWTLCYKRPGGVNPKTGKVTIKKWECYFPTIEMALQAYIDNSVKIEGNVNDVLVKLDELKSIIRKVYELRVIK